MKKGRRSDPLVRTNRYRTVLELVAPDDVPLVLESPLSDGYRLCRSSSLRFWSYVDPLLADSLASPLRLVVPVDDPSPLADEPLFVVPVDDPSPLIDEPLELCRSPLIEPVLADPVPLADPAAAPL